MVRRSWRHVALGIALLALIVLIGTIGYMLLGFGALDATYQTVTTITTVGFREVEPLSSAGKVFTIVLILAGVGTALYTLTVGLELLVEGHFGLAMERRRMDKQIASFRGHVIVCGWGRVGKAIARELAHRREAGRDHRQRPRSTLLCSWVSVHRGGCLRRRRAPRGGHRTCVGARRGGGDRRGQPRHHPVGHALQPDLFIVARAREETSAAKLERAGANRVVNPQEIGGARMAAFLVQPHVTEFLDVVMHDREMELRLEELEIAADSPLAHITVGQAHVRDQTGALILAIRDPDGGFITSPGASTRWSPATCSSRSARRASSPRWKRRRAARERRRDRNRDRRADDRRREAVVPRRRCAVLGGPHLPRHRRLPPKPVLRGSRRTARTPGLRVLRRTPRASSSTGDVLPGDHGPRRDVGPRSRGADRRGDRPGAAGDRRHALRRRVRQRAAPPRVGSGAGDVRRGSPPRRRDRCRAHPRRAAPRDGDA